jgi:uncharacterized membrane protein
MTISLSHKILSYIQIAFIVILCGVLFFSLTPANLVQATQQEDSQANFQTDNPEPIETETMQGEIKEIIDQKTKDNGGYEFVYQRVKCFITQGSQKGETVEIEVETPIETQERTYKVGDRVQISYYENAAGQDIYQITDYVRQGGLIILFIMFAFLAILIASKNGLYSLISMVLTFIIIVKVFLPLILNGTNPVLLTIGLSFLIIPLTFYLSHGFKKETTVAILGTSISLIVTGMLAQLFIKLTYLQGFSSEDAFFLQNLGKGSFNMQGILLAGIIVGLIGILDDISISQASLIYQLALENPNLTIQELFKKSMKLGKNHIASMVNTLILVYAGSSLPLLLLFAQGDNKFWDIVNNELIATEIVHTLIGSIGLILTVPITTLLASYFVSRNPEVEPQDKLL